MNQKQIGSFMKELRKEKGITQEQLAEQLNVSSRTVSRWETGSNMPDISLLVEISEFYHVSILEIINGERKSENMNEEVKNVAAGLSDYASLEKETLLKNIRTLSFMGLFAMILYYVMTATGVYAQNALTQYVQLYAKTLTIVVTIMMPVYSTGLLGSIQRRKRSSRLPKYAMLLISVLAQVILAAGISGCIAFLMKQF